MHKEMAIVVMEIFVSRDNRLAMGLNRTKAESQNTGIETKYPVMANPRAACFLPVIFKMVLAIVSAAPDFSSSEPVTVPRAMTRPMSATVPPIPSAKAFSMGSIPIPETMAKTKDVAIKAKNG